LGEQQQKLITIQSLSLLKVVFACVANALPIYEQHVGRPPVAMPENIDSSAIVLLLVALESHMSRLMYFKSEGLTTEASVLAKLDRYLPGSAHAVLRDQAAEVTVCRDAVVHALLWEETRRFDHRWRLLHQSWTLAPVTALRNKVKQHVELGAVVTKRLAINVVPTNVDVVDVAKALVVVCRVMRDLEQKWGNPAAWIGPFPSAEELVPLFLGSRRDDDLEAWIAGVLRRLHAVHRQDVVKRLDITELQVDGEPTFVGISSHR
jgi:hypothetical protein